MFSEAAKALGVRLYVFSCVGTSPGKLPDYAGMAADNAFLCERIPANNIGVIAAIARVSPDVVITDGLELNHVYGFFYAILSGLPHIPMTDDTVLSEKNQGTVYRTMRRFMYTRSSAFISSGQGGQHLYEAYGIGGDQCFQSSLCVDNEIFSRASHVQKKRFDFIFCGRIEAEKNPLFAVEVAVQVAKRLRRKIKLLFVGAGDQDVRVKKAALLYPGLIEAEFTGFVTQKALPDLYGSAQILLLPARREAWGVMANEACAAGLPVIVSPYAGVAGELVRDGENGFVCPIDVNLWADKAEYLLTQSGVYQDFSARSRYFVGQYNTSNAALGLIAASRKAIAVKGAQKERRRSIRSRPRVVIVERQLLNYRVAFYNRLRDVLNREGIDLLLLIGEGTSTEKKKKNEVMLDWAIKIPTRYLPGTSLCWQPFWRHAREADLVIVMHENKILYNLWLLFFDRPKRIAFWGHGVNLQSSQPNGFKERFKRWTVNKVDWWFAYTDSSAALVTRAGFPSERTTIVENAIDTEEMASFCKQVTADQCRRKRQELGLTDGPIGLYLGSLYKEKRLDFLLEAALRIRQKIPDFQLLIVGAGSEEEQIQAAANTHSWIHYLGPLQDQRKAEVLVLADVMLNPGLVGLGILDSFTSGTPMFTTDCGIHSPEISYLASGTNGVMTSNDVDAYADTVAGVLMQPEAIARLSKGALSSAPRYTVENMADRIRKGICACLSS
ncbi:MAG: glycosyltransferase [Pseudomonadota bacterium]